MVAGGTTPLRILIATGDIKAGRLLAEHVRLAGHHPVLVIDGSDVLDWFEREAGRPHSIDLAILDAALPGYPGIALAACARTNALEFPLILMQDGSARLGAELLLRLGLLGIMTSRGDTDELRAFLDEVSRPRLARGTSPGFGSPAT